MHQLALVVLVILFLIIPFELPQTLTNAVDNNLVIIMISFLIIVGFYFLNPLVAGFLLVFAFELIRRSKKKNGTLGNQVYIPSENKKIKFLTSVNDFSVTLEEEVVKKMVPVADKPIIDSAPSYKPVYGSVNNASNL